MASQYEMRRSGSSIVMPILPKASASTSSRAPMTSSWRTKLISMSTCVNSG